MKKMLSLFQLGVLRNGMNYDRGSAVTGCKIIGVADFGNKVFPDYKTLQEIDSDIVSNDDLLHDGDILFVRSNGNKNLVGRSMFIKDISEPICYSGFCIMLRPNPDMVFPQYLFYALRSPFCRKQYSYSQQTNITNLSQAVLGSVIVPVPDYEEQVKLSRILYNIDQKIQNNNLVCAELEAMAKTLYDYWFVQFDFPDENGRPYRVSGGEMVWNEQLKREIPKGWMCVSLSDFISIENSSVNPATLGTETMEHYSIPAYDDNFYPAFEQADTIQSGKYRVHKNSILVSKLNPQFKRIWDPFCISENAICSTEFMVYIPCKDYLRPFCFALVNSDGFYQHMVSKAISSTGSRRRIQPDVSLMYRFAAPNTDSLLSAFSERYLPIMDKLKQVRLENQELTKLRDWLLPMLMNGQATVE